MPAANSDWAFQSNQAAGEISQIFKQIRAAEIRQAVAELELRNHRQQMQHATEIEQFLNEEGTNKKGKKTNKALYAYLKREVKALYAQCFQMAFDVARKAERALQHELGDTSLTFLQFGYLAGKEGLLAGERLHMDLKRMELAYLELNQREYELTKHVSLLQVDPQALIAAPRRPAVARSSSMRICSTWTAPATTSAASRTQPSPSRASPGRTPASTAPLPCSRAASARLGCRRAGLRPREPEDNRFADYYGSMQSIVTSSAQNDGGLFETNLRDERYLPFENSGVISEWQLQLPADPSAGDPAQFDYDTISDVVLHIRYTAREGGDALGKRALADLKSKINAAEAVGCGAAVLAAPRLSGSLGCVQGGAQGGRLQGADD